MQFRLVSNPGRSNSFHKRTPHRPKSFPPRSEIISFTKAAKMDAFTPQQTVELVSRIGTKKAHMRLDKLFFNSLMAGSLLDFGFVTSPSSQSSPYSQMCRPPLHKNSSLVPRACPRSNPYSGRSHVPHRPRNDRPHRSRPLHLQHNVHDNRILTSSRLYQRSAHLLGCVLRRQSGRDVVLHGSHYWIWRSLYRHPGV